MTDIVVGKPRAGSGTYRTYNEAWYDNLQSANAATSNFAVFYNAEFKSGGILKFGNTTIPETQWQNISIDQGMNSYDTVNFNVSVVGAGTGPGPFTTTTIEMNPTGGLTIWDVGAVRDDVTKVITGTKVFNVEPSNGDVTTKGSITSDGGITSTNAGMTSLGGPIRVGSGSTTYTSMDIGTLVVRQGNVNKLIYDVNDAYPFKVNGTNAVFALTPTSGIYLTNNVDASTVFQARNNGNSFDAVGMTNSGKLTCRSNAANDYFVIEPSVGLTYAQSGNKRFGYTNVSGMVFLSPTDIITAPTIQLESLTGNIKLSPTNSSTNPTIDLSAQFGAMTINSVATNQNRFEFTTVGGGGFKTYVNNQRASELYPNGDLYLAGTLGVSNGANVINGIAVTGGLVCRESTASTTCIGVRKAGSLGTNIIELKNNGDVKLYNANGNATVQLGIDGSENGYVTVQNAGNTLSTTITGGGTSGINKYIECVSDPAILFYPFLQSIVFEEQNIFTAGATILSNCGATVGAAGISLPSNLDGRRLKLTLQFAYKLDNLEDISITYKFLTPFVHKISRQYIVSGEFNNYIFTKTFVKDVNDLQISVGFQPFASTSVTFRLFTETNYSNNFPTVIIETID